MRGFTGALDVRCQSCHVGREGMPLDSFDFASDEKRIKRTARIMLQMVRRIDDAVGMLELNAEFFPQSPGVPFARGEVYLIAGDTTSAITWYRKALAADSTFPSARFRLRQLRRGRMP